MSPYEFTGKTHSLSTEDLGKFFIHSLIYLSTPWETFTLDRTVALRSGKIARKSEKNWMKVKNTTQSCHEVEEAVFSVQG